MNAFSTRILALSLGLGLLATGCDKAEDEGAKLPPASGEEAPERGEIPRPSAEASASAAKQIDNQRWVGTVKAKQHVEIAPSMGGVIAAINFEEGDTVNEGDVLLKISGSAMRKAVNQAQAGVTAAELGLAEAEREAARTRKLAERGSVGAANLERAESGVEQAKAAVKQAKAAVASARARTSDLSVESPISGVVTGKYKSVGEVAMTMPPTVVLVIDNYSTIEVRVRVPELKLRDIDVGSDVHVYFPALDLDKTVPITRIGGAVDPRTRTIELIIEVDNQDLRVKPGMSVEVEIGSKAAAGAPAANTEPEAGDQAKPAGDESAAASPTAMLDTDSKPG